MEEVQTTQHLGTENLTKLIFKFSIPCILSLLISSLYNIVDQIFIGNSKLSTLGNAATGVVFPVFIIAQAFAWCFGDGCASYLNICQGKNDATHAHKAIGGSITISVLSGFLMMAVIYPLKTPILTLFGATENSMAYAVEYLDIILAMIPVYIFSNTLNSVIRADGSPLWAMISILAGAIINVILDPVFIFILDMGMSGAAIATAIGQAVTFVLTLGYFFNPKTFRLRLDSFYPHLSEVFEVVKLGVSTFITQLAIVIVAILCNVQLAKYGALSKYGVDIPIAVIGIESKIFSVVISLVVGIVLGCQPIISYNIGAQKYDRVRELYRKILISTILVGLAFTALFECAPRFVLGLFGEPKNIPNPQDYWEFGEKTLRIFLSLLCLSCVIKMHSIFFQASGKPTGAIIASLVRDVICFTPLVLLLPLWNPAVETILWAAPISDFIAMIATALLAVIFLKELR